MQVAVNDVFEQKSCPEAVEPDKTCHLASDKTSDSRQWSVIEYHYVDGYSIVVASDSEIKG